MNHSSETPGGRALRIAVVSKADHFGGGASRVASELTSLLNAAGHHADHWLSWAGGELTDQQRKLYGSCELPIRAANLVLRRVGFPELIPFELPALLFATHARNYDLLHFHDLSSAISPLSLLYLSRSRPVAWTIHDCSPFTGGCLYPMDCRRFQSRCRECPQLGVWPIDSWFDFTGFQQGLKRRVAGCGRVQYLTPSAWMQKMAVSSGLFHTSPEVLHNGVDLEVFCPRDKAAVRQQLGLPLDRQIVLLAAGSLADERKGARQAISALLSTRDLRPYILMVGSRSPQIRELLNGFDLHETGYLGRSTDLAQHYAAADLFLFTSLADNQPLVVLETMATGTPIVGFATGGIPEMIVQNQNGYLATPGDIDSLSASLRQVLSNPATIHEWSLRGIGKLELARAFACLLLCAQPTTAGASHCIKEC